MIKTNNKLVYLIGNNAAEGENCIKYVNSYVMNCMVNNCLVWYTFE